MASDSLAAESVNAGGAFSANRGSEPLSVSGSKSTFNNTDTSGATTLSPAPDATEREAKAAWQDTSDEAKGPGGVKYSEASGKPEFPGAHNADGYSGGSSAAKQQTGLSGTSSSEGGATTTSSNTEPSSKGGATSTSGNTGSSSGTSNNSLADTAPSYVTSVTAAAADGKPKGSGLTEGGFDSNPENNASFTSDIGTEDDPGRAAELKFAKQNTVHVGTGPKQGGPTGAGPDAGQYDILETDQNL